jgi:hypothetical protein
MAHVKRNVTVSVMPFWGVAIAALGWLALEIAEWGGE